MKCRINQNYGSRTRQRCFKGIIPFVFIVAFAIILMDMSPSCAELKALSQGELKTTTAQAGFTDFTLSNNTARLFLDIHIETNATIANFSAGNYNNGFDQHWNTITLGRPADSMAGTPAEPLVIDGLVFRADFDNLSATDPVLERIVIGSNRLQGAITTTLASFSGMYNDALTGGLGSPVTGYRREDLGTAPITFNFNSNASSDSSMGLFFILNTTSTNFGIQVVAGYDEKTISTTFHDQWWNSP